MTAAREKFINDNLPLAMEVCKGSGIYPEVLLTQAIIESQKNVNGIYTPGASALASKYNNYFGIKATADWKGKQVTYNTREFVNDFVQGIFRAYGSKRESFNDYINFLKSNPRYTKAGVFSALSPEAQVKAIAQAGYATDPTYSTILQSVLRSVIEVKKKVTSKWQVLDLMEF